MTQSLHDEAALIAHREYASQRAVQDADDLPDHLRHEWPHIAPDYRALLIGCVLAGMSHVGGL